MSQVAISGALSFLFSSSRARPSSSLSLTSYSCSFLPRVMILRKTALHHRTIHQSNVVMMPEGPEVRTLVDQLQGGVGMRLVNISFISGRYVRQGNKPVGFAEFAKTMTRDKVDTDIIKECRCKGKFMYLTLDNGRMSMLNNNPDFMRSIWITLGMTGRFMNEQRHFMDSRHARWYLLLKDPHTQNTKTVYYHDARNFGTLSFCLSREALQKKIDSLGLDILDSLNTTEEDFVKLVSMQKPHVNICKFLMDQSKICGIGNYILAEGLYRSGMDPFASLNEINAEQQRRLFRELQATALESYNAQRLLSSRPGKKHRHVGVEENKGRGSGQFAFALQCYGRKYCARGKPVIRDAKGPHGRTIWYTEDQLFKPRSMRSVTSPDMNAGHLDDVEMPVTCNGTSRDHHGELVSETNDNNKDSAYFDSKKRLLSGLVEEGWKSVLSDAIASPTFDALAGFHADERRKGVTIFPPEHEVFAAMNMCPFDDVKVVIMGQDPYHGRGQGHGLAFSVRKGVRPPPSLKNIFKEAMDDVHITPPEHGYLEHWTQQGVLLLNAVLTVREGEANSHAGQGWEEFTDCVIDTLNEKKEGLVFLLWGKPAAKKASGVDDQRHTVIKTSHPSPLGATKTDSPFLGSRCFSRANKALEKYGKTPIDWSVR